MKAKELEEIARRLYGAQWQTKLARRLHVEPRTVYNWKTTNAVSEVVACAMGYLAAERDKKDETKL